MDIQVLLYVLLFGFVLGLAFAASLKRALQVLLQTLRRFFFAPRFLLRYQKPKKTLKN